MFEDFPCEAVFGILVKWCETVKGREDGRIKVRRMQMAVAIIGVNRYGASVHTALRNAL